MNNPPPETLIDQMMKFEDGTLSLTEVIKLFSTLKKLNMVNTLQGLYGRTFINLVNVGFLDQQGNITQPQKDVKNDR